MTTLKISPADHLREVVSDTHSDMKVAVKMLRKLRLPSAWRKFNRGLNRLDKALNTMGPIT